MALAFHGGFLVVIFIVLPTLAGLHNLHTNLLDNSSAIILC